MDMATDMFIRNGFKAVSFLGIARELGVTHSHIHYYFRTKQVLAQAVVERYVASTTAVFRSIWTAEDFDLLARFVRSRDWIWRQYLKFNPSGIGGQNWGLLARFVSEADLLSPAIRKAIGSTLDEMDSYIEAGIDLAVRRGELLPHAPKRALVLQISSVLHTSQHLTRIGGSFERVEELLAWTFEVTQRAYGTPALTGIWPPLRNTGSRGTRSHSRAGLTSR